MIPKFMFTGVNVILGNVCGILVEAEFSPNQRAHLVKHLSAKEKGFEIAVLFRRNV